MAILTPAAAWSSPVDNTTGGILQCQSGSCLISIEADEPPNGDGFIMRETDSLVLEAGEDFRHQLLGPSSAAVLNFQPRPA